MLVNWKVTKRTVCLPICCLKKVTARPQLCRLLCILISKAFCQKNSECFFRPPTPFQVSFKKSFYGTDQHSQSQNWTQIPPCAKHQVRKKVKTAQPLCLQPWTEQKHYLANDALGEVWGLGSDRVGSSTHLAQVDGGIGVHCVDCFL